jgi:hypothetical protein
MVDKLDLDRLNDKKLLCEKLQIIVDDIIKNIINYHNLPIQIYETFRTPERQKQLIESKETSREESNHTTGEGVDFAVRINDNWVWDEKYEYYLDFLGIKVMELYGDKVTWGGIWPHQPGIGNKNHFSLKYEIKKEEEKKGE